MDILINAFKEKKVPYYWLSENAASKRSFHRNEPTVKLSTVESAKGLEFKVVFICNIDNFPLFLEKEVQREVSLMYIAMTRAIDKLYLSFAGESLFSKYLLERPKESDLVKNNIVYMNK